MATEPAKPFRPLRRVEYDKLVELGAFRGEHIELLDGQLVPMSPIGPPHTSIVQRLLELSLPRLLGRATVRCQNPFSALDLSEPEPDLAIVPLGEYDTAHPDQAYLIIEVADSSLTIDRGVKLRLYASCGVPEYWIVNLVENHVEVYSEPRDGSNSKVQSFDRSQSLKMPHFSDLELPVRDILK